MLLQIFILEACPDLQETKDDKRHTHTLLDIHIFPHGETADIWQRAAEHRTASKSTPTPRTPCLTASPEASCHPSKDPNPLRHKNHLVGWRAQEKGKKDKKRLVYHANTVFSSSQIHSKKVFPAGVQQKLYASEPAVTIIRFRGVLFNGGTFMDSGFIYLAKPITLPSQL